MTALEAYCEKVLADALVSSALERAIEEWPFEGTLSDESWERITERIADLIPEVTIAEMHAAYAYLSTLAESEES